MKEDFQRFWSYQSQAWADKFLEDWATRTMQSKLAPMKKVAKMLRSHKPLILNWFRAKGDISAGTVEGFNNKLKVITRKAYGFRTFQAAETALFHTLGDLPEPDFTHRFSSIWPNNYRLICRLLCSKAALRFCLSIIVPILRTTTFLVR